MKTSLRTRLLIVAAVLLGADPTLFAQANRESPPEVEVRELTQRADLIGREVVIDARVALFQFHPGRGFDEILLKQSDVELRLPARLRFTQAPSQHQLRAQGVLGRDDRGVYLDVRSLQLMPDDHERLEKALAQLPAGEMNTRKAWGRWALSRGKFYKDAALEARGRAIEGDLIAIEAGRPESRTPDATLALARRAREAGRPAEPVPASWAHRAFSEILKGATTAEDLQKLAKQVETYLPRANDPAVGRMTDLGAWKARYDEDPQNAYARAPAAAQAALDRHLLAEIHVRAILLRAKADPASAFTLAEEARELVPDRPELAAQLLEAGLKTATENVGGLRRSEVMSLVARYNESGKPEEGRALIRSWLEDQRRKKLGRNDADGRVALADQFRTLLGDNTTALALLNEAAKLDPQSKEVADAFRRLGYRFDGNNWVAARSTVENRGESAPADPSDPLIGLTQEEILSQRGKPNRRSVSITQGSLLVQWSYQLTGGTVEYLNFVKRPGTPAVVESRFVLR